MSHRTNKFRTESGAVVAMFLALMVGFVVVAYSVFKSETGQRIVTDQKLADTIAIGAAVTRGISNVRVVDSDGFETVDPIAAGNELLALYDQLGRNGYSDWVTTCFTVLQVVSPSGDPESGDAVASPFLPMEGGPLCYVNPVDTRACEDWAEEVFSAGGGKIQDYYGCMVDITDWFNKFWVFSVR